MKTTKLADHIYRINFSMQELYSYKFIFNHNEFYFYDAIKEFQSEFI